MFSERGGRVQNLISCEKEKKMHHESLNLVSQKKTLPFISTWQITT